MLAQADRMKRKYRLIAPAYDLLELAFAYPRAVDPRRALASKIPDAGLDLLDLCCGTGNGVLALANSSNRVVGVDVSRSMLAVARRKIQRRAIENISVEEMEASRLRFEDQRFDVVTTSFAMHEFEREAMCVVLAEARRVLKAGGRLYIVDYARQRDRLSQAALWVYLRLAYPSHVREFLDCDWAKILASVGLRLEATEQCFFSSLVVATNAAPAETTLSDRPMSCDENAQARKR
jgi:ubiquinone/menaquinone biosynthesis C-methylase UbiE